MVRHYSSLVLAGAIPFMAAAAIITSAYFRLRVAATAIVGVSMLLVLVAR